VEASDLENADLTADSLSDPRPNAASTLRLIADLAVQLASEIEAPEPAASNPNGGGSGEASAFRFGSLAPDDNLQNEGNWNGSHTRTSRPPLPDPRLLRRIIRQRQLRAQFFDGDIFADPAWDMLLDLAAARVEHTRVSVTSLCIASNVPATTALRWIGQMTDAGLFQRVDDQIDRRRAFIALTDKAADAMARYFARLGGMARQLV
jgi:DNA-binding MarR family transcriptional regulator